MTAQNPYYADDQVTLHLGNCLDVLPNLPNASIDAVITDPPYELGMMGKAWDATGIAYSVDVWRQCWRVLKPGGHLVAFGGTRTYHRMVVAIEDAGFEIRDSIAWMYGSGLPKSLNLVDADGERTGRGTALKPAFEPITVARSPLAGTVAANVTQHGTGALNIDDCRVPMSADDAASINAKHAGMNTATYQRPVGASLNLSVNPIPLRAAHAHDAGRWPTNAVLSHQPLLGRHDGQVIGDACATGCVPGCPVATFGAEARFFPAFRYEAKAPTSERPRLADGTAHPTVKPLALMQWLVRLVTPSGGTVLDPFAGSGTTLQAAIAEGMRAIGVEERQAYADLTVARLSKPIALGLFGDTHPAA